MKFIDEAVINVKAGKGGDGCLSFRREKCVPLGGPNGGDGGDGGSVFLEGNVGINTLIEFRYKRSFRAQNGESGKGSNCTGKNGKDLIINVPLGTLVYDQDTQELLADIDCSNRKVKVTQGGVHGLGNTRFKTSTNRAPRKITKGSKGESRTLYLELKLLADVGLIGLPNAGKSTFIRAISTAKPKVADYPFTTLCPNLGVVRVDTDSSFVVADIPGLIEGAAEGVGLGIQFLKHIARTKLLLHLVDIAPLDDSDPVEAIKVIEQELRKFGSELIEKPRWLILNKLDLIPEKERESYCDTIKSKLDWHGKIFAISALNKTGLRELIFAVRDVLLSV